MLRSQSQPQWQQYCSTAAYLDIVSNASSLRGMTAASSEGYNRGPYCLHCLRSNQSTQPTPAPIQPTRAPTAWQRSPAPPLPTPAPTPVPTPVPTSVPTPVPTPGGFNPYDPNYPGSRISCVVLAGVNVKASALQQGLPQLRQAAAINPIACAIQCFAQADCMFWLAVNSNCVQYGPAPTVMQLEAVSGQSSGAYR